MAKRRKKTKSKKKKKFNTNFRKAVKRDSERQQQAQNNYGYLNIPQGVSVWNPTPGGRHYLDFMPYVVTDPNHPDKYEDEGIAVEGELWYKRPFKMHRNIGVENDGVICPRSFGKPCPICEYRERRLKEGADWEELKDIKAKQRNLYVVIPRKSKEHEEVPHIWDMSQYLFQNLLNQELEEDEDYAVFPSLEEGKTLKVRFDKESIGSNTFAEASRIDFLSRKKSYDYEILDDVPNLDEVLELLTYEELEAKFMELDPEDLVEDEGKPSRRKKSAKPDPDDEFEEEEFEDEEFEDEEFEDEEWEEEEDFEEEEFEDEEFEEEEFEDEEFEEDWEEELEEEFEEEEPEPKPKPKKRTRSKKSKRKRKK